MNFKRAVRAQLGLFQDVAAVVPDAARYALDGSSWVDHFPGWYQDAARLFAVLAERAAWEQRSRWMFTRTVIEPRLTVEFPTLELAPSPEIRSIGERLSRLYGVKYDSAWLNFYRDESDSTSWHADRPANRPLTSIVPVVSLGATRRFLIRPKEGGRSVRSLRVPHF